MESRNHRSNCPRIAVLGDDPQLVPLVRGVLDRRGTVVWLGETDGITGVLRELAPDADCVSPWESLIDGVADGVIVGPGPDDEHRAEQLRRLAQASVPMLLLHPVSPSLLIYYELDMIRREMGCHLQFYVPGASHPGLARMAELAQKSEPDMGRIAQLNFERAMEPRDESSVMRQFARDIEWIRRIAGLPQRLAALGAGDHPMRYDALGVQMSMPSGMVARWTVAPVATTAGAKLVLVAARGRATLELPDPGTGEGSPQPHVTVELNDANEPSIQTYEDQEGAGAAVESWIATLQGERQSSEWIYAARSLELAEMVARSLRTGRTIEPRFEEHSESASVKSVMATVGCLLLMATIPLILLAGVSDAFGFPLTRNWSAALLVVLVLFLLFQWACRWVISQQTSGPGA